MKQSKSEMSHVMNVYGKCRYRSTFSPWRYSR